MVKIEVEKVNAERTNVRFAVYSDGKIWLKVSFAKDEDGRVHSLFKCREFYDETGRLANTGPKVLVPLKTFAELANRASAILKK